MSTFHAILAPHEERTIVTAVHCAFYKEPVLFSTAHVCLFGGLGRTRTFNLLIRSQVLYPIKLRGHVVPPTGFEPVTHELKARCSTC